MNKAVCIGSVSINVTAAYVRRPLCGAVVILVISNISNTVMKSNSFDVYRAMNVMHSAVLLS